MEKQESRIIKTFDKNAKLYKCCAVDDFRPVMQRIYFKNGYAIASDMNILIKVPLSEISDMNDDEIKMIDGKFIHYTAYKQLLKYNYMQIEYDGIIAFNDSYVKTKFLFIEDDCKYPDYNSVLKKSFESKKQISNIINNISFNPSKLNSLCSAFPTHVEAPILFLGKDNESILVGFECFKSIGLIMPCLSRDANMTKIAIQETL